MTERVLNMLNHPIIQQMLNYYLLCCLKLKRNNDKSEFQNLKNRILNANIPKVIKRY